MPQFGLTDLNYLVAEATKETHGVVVYQESIMLMLRRMGFTWPEADKWVKGLKISTKTMAISLDEFLGQPIYKKFADKLVEEYGVSREDAEAFTEKFTSYSFNKGHAVGYAMTAYWQMWLKVHYPLEFWCATMDLEDNDEKRAAYMVSAARGGVIFLPPHVNGTAQNTIEDNAIRVGTLSVKSVGEKASAALQAARPYSSAEDLEARVPKRAVNAGVRKALAEAGALEFDDEVLLRQATELNAALREAKINLRVFQKRERVEE